MDHDMSQQIAAAQRAHQAALNANGIPPNIHDNSQKINSKDTTSAWNNLSPEAQLELILRIHPIRNWLKEPLISVLASFRDDPLQWPQILFTWRERDSYMPRKLLEEGVDHWIKITREHDRKDDELSPKEEEFLQEMNRRYAMIVQGAGSGKIMEFPNYVLHNTPVLKGAFENKRIEGKNGLEFWLKHPLRRNTHGLIFRPGLAPGEQKDGTYNMWEGFSVEPSEEGTCEKYLTHIQTNICRNDEVLYHSVLSWMAHLVQFPEDRSVGVMLCLQGEPGTGKGTFVHWFGALFGNHYFPAGKDDDITGRFNWILHAKLLVFLDDTVWSGDRKTHRKLGMLITEEKMTLEQKYGAQLIMPNYMRFISSTNEEWSAPWQLGERRHKVLHVGDDHKEDRPYFTAIKQEMENGGLAKLLWTLQQWNVPKNFGFDAFPLGEADAAQAIQNATPEVAFWREILTDQSVVLLESGDRLPPEKNIPNIFQNWDKEITVVSKEVYALFARWCKAHNISRHTPDTERFSAALKPYMPSTLIRKQKKIAGKKEIVWELPTLEVCRKTFTARTHYQFLEMDE